jgi:hypothetical protein
MGSLVEELRRREVVNSSTRVHSAIPGSDLRAGSRGAAGDPQADGRARALY